MLAVPKRGGQPAAPEFEAVPFPTTAHRDGAPSPGAGLWEAEGQVRLGRGRCEGKTLAELTGARSGGDLSPVVYYC